MKTYIAWIIVAAATTVVPWWQYQVLSHAEEMVHTKYNQAIQRNVELSDRIDKLEQAVCHEINMRSIRPAERLSAKQCIDFIDGITKDARKESDPGKGLTWMLTPSPTACPPLDQYCQKMKENK